MGRLITAPPKFKILVANIENAGDPSRGFNPVKVRTGFEKQLFPEVPRAGAPTRSPDSTAPGVHTYQGLLGHTVPLTPVASTGTVEVVNTDFTATATLYLGGYILISNEDYLTGAAVQAEGSLTVVNTPSAADITLGAFTLTAAAGARTPGNDDYDGTLGTTALIVAEIIAAINDGANSFAGTVTAAAGLTADDVALTAVPIGSLGNAVALASSAADVTVSGAALANGVDALDVAATNLAAAIDGLPEYTAVAVGAVITITGPFGPNGNELRFEDIYAGTVANFTLTPTDGSLTSGEPFIGPPTILP